MNKRINLLIAFTASALFTLAANMIAPEKPVYKTREWYAPQEFQIISSSPYASLDQNHARFELKFADFQMTNQEALPMIELSCNGVIERFQLDSSLTHIIDVSPGKYKFMLIRTGEYNEIITDSITILPTHLTKAEIRFSQKQTLIIGRPEPIISYKPVIYFYSPKDLSVNVELTPKGNFTYTYPAYENGWKGMVDKNGGITINNKHYPYVFWEGTNTEINALVDYNQGFVVSTENVTVFLEEKLTEMGLNDQERTDFITFWAPRMVGSEKNHVQFIFNEAYDDIATLSITPKPDHTFRLYMLWTPLPESVTINPTPQTLLSLKRDGFSVVEWGGSELTFTSDISFTH
ncbi:MAG: hypothetical protein HYZ43_02940 [Flavobacteriia bacterium]|nr:hypothetical protein [Flavobacteriia bacterium]